MIRKIIFFILYSIVLIYLLVLFLPKSELYYYGLNIAKKYNINITEEIIDEKNFSLKISKPKVLFNQIEIGTISSVNMDTLLFKSSIYIDGIKIDNSFQQFVPLQINFITLNHNLLDPLNINIYGKGTGFNLHGVFNIIKKTIYIYPNFSQDFINKYGIITTNMKKTSNGKYYFEYAL